MRFNLYCYFHCEKARDSRLVIKRLRTRLNTFLNLKIPCKAIYNSFKDGRMKKIKKDRKVEKF